MAFEKDSGAFDKRGWSLFFKYRDDEGEKIAIAHFFNYIMTKIRKFTKMDDKARRTTRGAAKSVLRKVRKCLSPSARDGFVFDQLAGKGPRALLKLHRLASRTDLKELRKLDSKLTNPLDKGTLLRAVRIVCERNVYLNPSRPFSRKK